MEQVGEVTGVKAGKIEITFCRPEECEKCKGCEGHHKATVIEVAGEAEIGDAAVVALPDQTLVKASLLGYVLPLAGLLGGMAVGYFAAGNDAMTAVGGIVGLGVTLAVTLLTERKRRASAEWQPQLVRIIPKIGEL